MKPRAVLIAFLLIGILFAASARAEGELGASDLLIVRYFSNAVLVKTLTVNAAGDAIWDVKEPSLVNKIDSTKAFFVRDKKETPVGSAAVAPAAGGAPSALSPDYRIGAGDTLEISVWDNQQLSRTTLVRPDGVVTLPLLGEVRAGGLLVEELKNQLQKELTRFIEKPVVTITVTAVASYQVYVQGQVTRPGGYPISGSSTITHAISLAGGFTPFADKNRILILRKVGGSEKKFKIKYKKIVAGKIPNVVVMPGDTVIVP